MRILIIFILIALYSSNAKEEEEKEKGEEADSKEKETTPEKEAVNLPPHILFILADDLGWNDVSFHGSPQIPTPNIDALASSSILLNNYYTESLCSRARSAILSGNYPIHTGLQHSIIKSGEPTGLPLEVMIMPEHLKNKGYRNHMIGKWQLGYSKKDYTPTNRGFDSFFGFYNEQIDYYDYTNYDRAEDPNAPPFYGIDLQDGTETVKKMRGKYATDVFTERALDIITSHNDSEPLFLYLSHLAPHTGNEYMPLQAPLTYVAKNAHIPDAKRRTYAGMVSALDESLKKLISAFHQRGFLDNSIIVFTSDNGGDTGSYQKGAASNWPLRGQKGSSWEGAIRVPCFIWSPLLGLKEPKASNQLMHASDWLPTLYAAIGGEGSDLGKIDGVNMWKALVNNLPSPRIEILHNIDPITGMSALRRGDYKLIMGTTEDATANWYKPSGLDDMKTLDSVDDWVFNNDTLVKKILEDLNFWLPKTPDAWRINASVNCMQPPPDGNGGCDPNQSPCLFNIAADPCEYNNLAQKYPRIVRSMVEILKRYNETAVEPLSPARDPQADPRCHSFSCVPWLDEEFAADCPFAL